MKASKTIQNLVKNKPDKFKDYYFDSDGHWIQCAGDWFSPSTECQTLHEMNVSSMLVAMGCIKKGYTP